MAKIDDMGLVYEDSGAFSRVRWGSKRRYPTKEAFATELAEYEGIVIPLDEIGESWLRFTLNQWGGADNECGEYEELHCAGRGHSPVWRWLPVHKQEEYQSCAAVWDSASGTYVNPPVAPYSATLVPASTARNAAAEYRCQFCGYFGPGWSKDGTACPKCGKTYDCLLAQDSEE